MDKLTREIHDHGKIQETMIFFEKFIRAITSDDVKHYSARIHKFTDEYIVQHFSFEEQEIFPLLLELGSTEEKELIKELEKEHGNILLSLAKFLKILFSYGSQPNKEEVKQIIRSSETVVSQILLHARKEDKRLFPLLKKYKM
jgi:hemerythrin-like domain-containing protein